MQKYILLGVCFVIILLIALKVVKSPSPRKKSAPHKTIPISKFGLFMLANGHSIVIFLMIALAAALIFAFAWQAEHMNLRSACISWMVTIICIGMGFIPVFHTKSGAWKMMKLIKDFDLLAKGKTMGFYIDGWYYSDRDLLICIGRNSACILYAPLIDFSVKFRYESSTWRLYKASSAYYKRFAVPLKDGGKIKQMLAFNNIVCNWIHSHGGRITGID